MEMLSEIVEMISTTQIQVILIAFIVIVVISNRRKRTSFKGAQVWPVVGLLPSLLFHFGDLYDWFTHLAILNGGTFRLPGPWKTKIFTADPANVEYVLRTRYHNFGKGDYFKDAFRDLLDGSLLVEDGERFRLLNKSVAMTLSSTEFRNTAAAAIPAAVHQKLLPVLRRAAENNTPIDLQDVFHRLAFDNICIVGFGVDPGSLSLDLHRDPILEASEGAMEAMMLRMFMPAICWKTMRYFNVGQERRLRIGREILYGFANEVFRRRGVDDSPSNLSDIMSGFIRVERESGRDYSEKQSLLALMVGLILAGKDNVKAGLTWFFWNLARHPEVEAKIVAELRDILERREIRDDSAPFSFEEVKAMDYLHAALSESLRLYPPVPEETTEPAEEDVLPDGTPVEKGAQLVYLIYASGRLESVWGKDCLEFKPERWLKNDVFVRESDFKFMVFNGGPRRCTGRDYAYSQMKWAAASILIRYRVEILDKHRVLPKFGAVLSMKYGLVAAIHPRAEACKCIK